MMRSLASLALAATVVSAVEPKASSAKQHLIECYLKMSLFDDL